MSKIIKVNGKRIHPLAQLLNSSRRIYANPLRAEQIRKSQNHNPKKSGKRRITHERVALRPAGKKVEGLPNGF